MANQDTWHVSKSVPATLLLGLGTQAAAIVWTVSTMQADIQRNAQDLIAVTSRMADVEDMVQSQAIAMGRIDENIMHIRGAVEKMSGK